MEMEPLKGRNDESRTAAAAAVAVVVVPFPAQGHLNQLLHFALILTSRGGVPVHYAAPSTHILQAKSRLHGWDSNSLRSIHFHDLPIPSFPTPSPDPDAATKFPAHLQPLFQAFDHARTPLAALLRTLSPASRRLVVVHDPLSSFAAEEAARLPNAESYAFQCIPASYHLSWHDEGSPGREFLRARRLDFPSHDGCFTDEFVAFAVRQQDWREVSSGSLFNTCREIEGEFVDVLAREPQFLNKKIYAVGPLNPVAIQQGRRQRHEYCLEWLDKQPPASVLYVSFGSTTTLPDAQIEQLAIALLNSEQRFIWVLRDADRGDISAEGGKSREGRLPQGFLEEVEGRGIVVRDWAPQLEILAHEATAAFVSHCGWNSCMESISAGVPIVGWPMHSDQPRNAVFVTEYLKVGVAVREWARREQTATAAEIEEAIRKVTVDDGAEEIRRRAKALGEAVSGAVADGGSSRAAFDAFIAHISR